MASDLCGDTDVYNVALKTTCVHVSLSVINEHAPLKTKWIKKEQVPYMNSKLRKTIHQRNIWRNKHFKNKRDKFSRQNYVK